MSEPISLDRHRAARAHEAAAEAAEAERERERSRTQSARQRDPADVLTAMLVRDDRALVTVGELRAVIAHFERRFDELIE